MALKFVTSRFEEKKPVAKSHLSSLVALGKSLVMQTTPVAQDAKYLSALDTGPYWDLSKNRMYFHKERQSLNERFLHETKLKMSETINRKKP